GRSVETAFCMRNRQAQNTSKPPAERTRGLDPYVNVAALEAQVLISHQGARQEPRLREGLKTVANTHHQAPPLRMPANRHDQLAGYGERSRAQIVTVGEHSRDRLQISLKRQLGVLVPYVARRKPAQIAQRVHHLDFRVRAGEKHDGGAHSSFLTELPGGNPG